MKNKVLAELTVALGLAPDTTLDEFVEQYKKTADDSFAATVKITELETALGEAKAEIEKLTIALDESRQTVDQLTEELQKLKSLKGGKTDKLREADDKENGADNVMPVKIDNPLPEKEMRKLGMQILKSNPMADKAYVTVDGECFTNPTAANNHRRQVGGRLLTIYRD
ncbi:MAG: hypothetical protein HC896_00060 [Bacteroidales bacterium]|nr:hypothetical protein [Bacteroidales bacterium]